MAKTIRIHGIVYPDLPYVQFQNENGDTEKFWDPVEIIDDTAGAGDTDHVWSADKTVQELNGKIGTGEKGAAGGVAELDDGGKVPAAQLPSYVDDVVEYADAEHFPVPGETGKIYIALDTNKTYRWSGSVYVEISESLALGETSSTAYRGDRGAEAYAHATKKGSAFVSGLYKVETNSEGHVTGATPVEKEDITALGIPGSQPDITGKADKVSSPTDGNFAGLDSNGNLTDSGHKHSDYLTSHQDISGKADKVSDATNGNFAGLDANGNLTDSGSKASDFLTEHQDISGKADKDTDAVEGNLAEFDSNGNPVDSGKSASDFLETSAIDDTAGTGDTDKVWSADKLANENTLTKTISTPAAIQSFSDGAEWPMEMEIAIEPVQSGTGDPSPQNVRPITGWDGANVTGTGKNLLNESALVNDYYISDTGTLVSHGSYRYLPEYIKIKPSTTYTVSANKINYGAATATSVPYYDENYNFISRDIVIEGSAYGDVSGTFTTPNNAQYIRFSVGKADRTTVIQIEEGSPKTTYEPYKGATYPISFGSAGTVYGGTLTVHADGTGKMVINKEIAVYDEDDEWVKSTTATYDVFALSGQYSVISRWDVSKEIISNLAQVSVNSQATENYTRINITTSNSQIRFAFSPYGQTTLDQFKTFLASNNLQLVANLATPITYTLSAPQVLSILGPNNVWADCGDINSLTYVRRQDIGFIREDTKGQIRTATAPIQTELNDAESSLAIVIDGDTAPKNIASGQYLFVKNHSTLPTGAYHATAAIASGANVTGNNTAPDADGLINALLSMIQSL